MHTASGGCKVYATVKPLLAFVPHRLLEIMYMQTTVTSNSQWKLKKKYA